MRNETGGTARLPAYANDHRADANPIGPYRRRQDHAGKVSEGSSRLCWLLLLALRLADHVARDHQLLDLAGAFVDPEQPNVAIEALDGVVADVAGAAVDLHRTIGDAAAHFRSEQLRACRFRRDVLSIVTTACRVEHHRPRRVNFRPAVGKHRLYQLELGDWLPELFACHGVGKRVGEHTFSHADADRSDVQPSLVENLHRGPESHALATAQELRCRHATILEYHVAGVRSALPHFAVDSTQREARCSALHDECRNATGTFVRRVGARHHGEYSRFRSVGDVTFGAVEDVVTLAGK